jgi:uncharacterized surface protein with fasciclin (FAS1) repeats
MTCSDPVNEINGTAYFIQNNNYLRVPTRGAGYYLAKYTQYNSQYSSFYTYLKSSNLFTPADSSIKPVLPGVYYTFLVPNNNAIAVAGLPLATATDSVSKSIINKFLLYHIIPNNMIYTNGKVTGINIPTMAQITIKNGTPVYATVNITLAGNSIQITDQLGNTPANIISGNFMAKQSTIHLIDRVLKFQ